MQQQTEKQQMTLGRYYLQGFANGIKKFTQSTPMVAIVNAFISAMPIIIAASIFTLIGTLPEMFAKLSNPNYSAKWLTVLQEWTGVVSNWSMGILGVFVTAALARNMIIALNQKLPLARRVNEQTVFFAAITVYLMLSVISFTVDNKWSELVHHTGRAIFVDGMAAQGILPGLIVGLTMPYFFYWGYKYNWTIRLPKQVPQTISQAFLAIVPLLVVYLVYGSIAYGLEKWLKQPVLFWLFSEILSGLRTNPNINDSYGLFTLYSFMESGFWFLGVHPEPVHAVMRAAFWFNNIADNANLISTPVAGNYGHLFTEPYAYGFAAMGGSGTTLMVPLLCLLFCRSTKLRITGKTAVLPIVFQVNEPALFGVPLILNPIFAIPFLFTGWINNMIFLTMWKIWPFQAGALYLPWSAPFFLVTTLGTPTAWQPYLMVFIALFISSIMYIPFLIIQDKIYMKEELAKLGNEAINFKPVTWADIIQRKIFGIDPVSTRTFKEWKNSFKKQIKALEKQQKIDLVKFNETSHTDEQKANFLLKQATELKQLKQKLFVQYHDELKSRIVKRHTDVLANSINFEKTLKDNRIKLATEKRERLINFYQDALVRVEDKIKKPLNKLETKLGLIQEKQADMLAITSSVNPKSLIAIHANKRAKAFGIKIKNLESKIATVKNKKPSLKLKKDPDAIYAKALLDAQYKETLAIALAVKSFAMKHKNYLDQSVEYAKYSKTHSNIDSIKLKYTSELTSLELANNKLITKNKESLANGTIPWTFGEQVASENKQVETTSKTKAARTTKNKVTKKNTKATSGVITTTEFDKNKKYNVIVICLGAGSSAVLANTIHDGLRAKGITNVESNAYAWGSHEAALDGVDLVLLSPQMGIHAKGMQSLSEAKGFKLHCFRGREYIEMSKDKKAAADFVINELGKK